MKQNFNVSSPKSIHQQLWRQHAGSSYNSTYSTSAFWRQEVMWHLHGLIVSPTLCLQKGAYMLHRITVSEKHKAFHTNLISNDTVMKWEWEWKVNELIEAPHISRLCVLSGSICANYYPIHGLQPKVLVVFCACWGCMVSLYTGLRARQTGLFTPVAHHTSLLHEVYTYCTGYIIVQYPNKKKNKMFPWR